MEEWRPIPSAAGYEVSSLGRIRSVERTVITSKGHARRYKSRPISASSFNQYGHAKFMAHDHGQTRPVYVHQAIAEAFIGSCPEGMLATHRDGCPEHNLLGNIRYATPTENQADRRRHGTHLEGERHPMSKLRLSQVQEIRRRVAAGEPKQLIAESFQISRGYLNELVGRRRWAWVA